MFSASERSPEDAEKLQQQLQRILYREFLGEPHLYRDVGLDQLPQALGELLGCGPDDGLMRAAASTFLDEFEIRTLRRLFRIRDMDLVSRTAAAVSAELKEPQVSYDTAVRRALSYAVIDLKPHAYAALRAAARKKPEWARHHYLYGVLQAMSGDFPRAMRALDTALQREPYEDARQRVRAAMALIEGPRMGPPLQR